MQCPLLALAPAPALDLAAPAATAITTIAAVAATAIIGGGALTALWAKARIDLRFVFCCDQRNEAVVPETVTRLRTCNSGRHQSADRSRG